MATRTNPIDYRNVAVGGQRCDQQDTAASGAGGADSILKNHQRAVSTISISCGLNDLFQGATEATTLSRILTYVSNRKSAGWKNIIVMTLTDAGDVSETDRANLNSDIRSNAAGSGYIVADPGGDANVGCNGCNTSTTYFQADHVHPTATGHGVVATYLETALTTAGIK